MSVLNRKELAGSPLADLHQIAAELGVEGYRAMRKDDLIAAMLAVTGAPDEPADEGGDAGEEAPEVVEDEISDEEITTGVLDVLANGSGFVRVDTAGQSREDVYVSPAQIRRCELRAGDEVSGPVRPPRRNERHPSLIRVESVNGTEAEPPEQRPWFGDLTPVIPSERLSFPAAFEVAPFGKGSRVAVAGPPGGGATTPLVEAARPPL